MSGRSTHARGSSLLRCILAFLAACGAVTRMHAAEIVTLRSGFTVTCSSREAVSDDTVRLFLAADGVTGGNYMDVPLASVLRIDAAPVQEVRMTFPVSARPATPWKNLVQSSGVAHNINVALLTSVIHAESAGNPHAVSRTGAVGLMQLMPSTAAQLRVKDSFAPEANVNGGSAYLDQLLTRYHDNIAFALAAYNAGPAAVDRYHGIPPYRETRLYVAKVLREFNRLVTSQGAAAMAAVLPNGSGQ